MRLRLFLALFGALIAAMFVPAAPASAQTAVCPFIFQPVCARTPSGALQTFSNACVAKAAKATVVHPGACNVFCPLIFAPVCGRKNGVNRTYSNSCVAMADGAVVLANGACPGPICTRIFRPVCAVPPGGGLRTFSNRCVAINAGARIIHDGKC